MMGFGKLVATGKLEVTAADGSKQTLEAKHIIIATGGRASNYLSLNRWQKNYWLPRSHGFANTTKSNDCCWISGAIGVEFGYFYNSMGTKVTIVEFLPRVVPVEDEEFQKNWKNNQEARH